MSRNSGAWGVAMWRDDSDTQANGISLEGGDAIVPFLPVAPLGCLTAPPDGLGVPPIRNSDIVLAQRDGVAQFEDFYENRILTFRVSICNDGCPGCPTGRAKVKRLLREWSRTCRGATLALFTDCHDPSATTEERVVTGPFLVRGRPRAAELTWLPSNFGCADVLLRFDARDHRLVILPPENDGETPWTGVLCEEVFGPGGGEVAENLAEDPHGRALTWDAAGSTGVITRPTTGGPHNQGYLQYAMTVANSSDPMTIHTAGSGVSGTPVVAGESYTISSYWYMTNNTANDQRYEVTWYTSAGGLISTSTGSDVGIATANTWWRGSQTFVAPANAAFARFTVVYAGIYSTQPSTLRVADILIEQASSERPFFFSGSWLGTWLGTADASTSITRVERINYAWDPRGTASSQWDVDGTAGSSYGESLVTGASDGPVITGTTTDTYIRYNAIAGGAAGTTTFEYEALHVPTEAFEIGDQITVSIYVRASAALTSPTVYLSQQVNGADGADVVGAAQANLVANVWTRLSETLTLTAYADGINVAGLQFPGNTIPNGTNIDIGYVLIEKASAINTYFDGTFSVGQWQGTENASISVLGPDAASLECSTALVLNGVAPGRASTPDAASLDITGDIDLRVYAALDDWTPAANSVLISKFNTTGNQRSYLFQVSTAGRLVLIHSADGAAQIAATSTASPTVANGEALWVRATLDVVTGGGHDAKFYTSTDGETWTQLGATIVTAGATSIFNGTAALTLGSFGDGTSNRLAGRIFYAEVRNGIGGTVVANPDFSAQAAGTTSFTDGAGLLWSVVSPAEIVTTDCPVSVTTYGDLCVYPAFTLDGPLTGPITIYYDGDSHVVYQDDVPAGLNNRVSIDAEFLRAYQGSDDVSAALSGVTPSSLPLGTTVITVTSGSPLDSGTVTVCWENAVVSG